MRVLRGGRERETRKTSKILKTDAQREEERRWKNMVFGILRNLTIIITVSLNVKDSMFHFNNVKTFKIMNLIS